MIGKIAKMLGIHSKSGQAGFVAGLIAVLVFVCLWGSMNFFRLAPKDTIWVGSLFCALFSAILAFIKKMAE
jgi:hypothetical protein